MISQVHQKRCGVRHHHRSPGQMSYQDLQPPHPASAPAQHCLTPKHLTLRRVPTALPQPRLSSSLDSKPTSRPTFSSAIWDSDVDYVPGRDAEHHQRVLTPEPPRATTTSSRDIARNVLPGPRANPSKSETLFHCGGVLTHESGIAFIVDGLAVTASGLGPDGRFALDALSGRAVDQEPTAGIRVPRRLCRGESEVGHRVVHTLVIAQPASQPPQRLAMTGTVHRETSPAHTVLCHPPVLPRQGSAHTSALGPRASDDTHLVNQLPGPAVVSTQDVSLRLTNNHFAEGMRSRLSAVTSQVIACSP